MRDLALRRTGPLLVVDVRAALHLVGVLVKWFALAFVFPVGAALLYGDPVWPFAASAALTAGFGLALERSTRGHLHVGTREGYLVVSLVWLLVSVLGALPYLLSGEDQLANPVDAFFESVSGFTTTGSSVLTDIPALDGSLLMWRQFTQFVGGMGIIVLALAVLPRLRVGGRQTLFHSESPGPDLPLAATIRATARRFVLLYVGLVVTEIVVLTVLAWTHLDRAMSFENAVAHAFSTIPTGGFSPLARGVEELGAASQWAIVPFMVVGGTSFTLLYAGLLRRRARSFLRDEEFRVYLFLMAAASLIVFTEVVSDGIAHGEEAVRQSVFNTVSIFTTTGYANADFNQWTAVTTFVLVGGMVVSASAGSTAGGIKLLRHVVIGKMLRRELAQTLHPELVRPIRVNGSPLDERTLRAIVVFAFIYVGLAATGALVILVDSALQDVPLSPFQAIAATASVMASVGPAFGFAGPMGSFEPFSDFSTAVLGVLMWLGRLEIIPILVLLTREYWRP